MIKESPFCVLPTSSMYYSLNSYHILDFLLGLLLCIPGGDPGEAELLCQEDNSVGLDGGTVGEPGSWCEDVLV